MGEENRRLVHFRWWKKKLTRTRSKNNNHQHHRSRRRRHRHHSATPSPPRLVFSTYFESDASLSLWRSLPLFSCFQGRMRTHIADMVRKMRDDLELYVKDCPRAYHSAQDTSSAKLCCCCYCRHCLCASSGSDMHALAQTSRSSTS